MCELGDEGKGDFATRLGPLTTAYEQWIAVLDRRIASGEPDLLAHLVPAQAAVAHCRATLERIRDGTALLDSDNTAAEAFRFANRAMHLQRVRSLYAAAVRRSKATELAALDVPHNRSWYVFQLAFILINLRSIADLGHPDRALPIVANALIEAIGRGVDVRICLESPGSGEHGPSYDPAIALGDAVCNSASIYVWPQEQRAATDHSRRGSLHAKCVVADVRLMFVSSANLTEYAMEHNIELGLLLDEPRLAGIVVSQFDHLIEHGILVRR